MIIDSHCHVYPRLRHFLLGKDDYKFKPASKLKRAYSTVMSPYLSAIHKLQESARLLPDQHLPTCDKIISALSTVNTLVDNNLNDLYSHMSKNLINYSVIIAHPPYIPNDFVLKLANQNKNILPVVNIPYGHENSVELFKKYIDLGAKALKIHAAADGGESLSDHYESILEIANDRSLPVIIHTGCIHIEPLYKDPQMGHAEHFEQWFDLYPKSNFILAHMNYHHPKIAIELCSRFKNVYLETSWQPKAQIVEAIKAVGAKKIMFGSDWPIMGNNISHALAQIETAYEEGLISKKQKDLVLGQNAFNLFKI